MFKTTQIFLVVIQDLHVVPGSEMVLHVVEALLDSSAADQALVLPRLHKSRAIIALVCVVLSQMLME